MGLTPDQSIYKTINLLKGKVKIGTTEKEISGSGDIADLTGAIQSLITTSQLLKSVTYADQSFTFTWSDGTTDTISIAEFIDATEIGKSIAAIQGETTHTIKEAYELADAAQTATEVSEAITTALSKLDQAEVGDAAKTLKISQANGQVTATAVPIKIAESQVDGLSTKLEDLRDGLQTYGGFISTIVGDDANKSMRDVAYDAASKVQGDTTKTVKEVGDAINELGSRIANLEQIQVTNNNGVVKLSWNNLKKEE